MTQTSTPEAASPVPGTADEAIIANKQLLMDALRAAGGKRAQIDYSGDGDSGQVNDVVVEPAIPLAREVPFFASSSTFEGGAWQVTYKQVALSLQHALEAFAYDVVTKHHDGYENGDGGSGEVIFDCESGGVLLEHRDYYVECVSTETQL